MNITEANRCINALNRIAESATMLAAAIEEAAWESFEDHAGMLGVRPVAAAQLSQPALGVGVEEHEASRQQACSASALSKEPQPNPVSLEQMRAALAKQ